MNHKPQIIFFCVSIMILLILPAGAKQSQSASNVLTDVIVNNDPDSGWVSFEFEQPSKPPVQRISQSFPDRIIITLPDTRIGGDLREGLFYENLFCADDRGIMRLTVVQTTDPPNVRLTLQMNHSLNSYVENSSDKIATLFLTEEDVPQDIPLRLVADASGDPISADEIDEIIRRKVHDELPSIGADIDMQYKAVEDLMDIARSSDYNQLQPEPSNKYRIQAGDKLVINVVGEPDFNSTVGVRPDGYITYTMLGDVIAEGLTPMELGMILKNRLVGKYFNYDISLTVTVIDYTPSNVYLIGNIPQAGPVIYRKGMTVLDVVSNFDREKVNLSDVAIIRKGEGRIHVNLEEVLNGDIDQNIELLPRDYVFLPSKDTIRVMVFGKVRSPGMFKLQQDARVYDAIASAGGYADRSNIRQIYVLRENERTTERIELDLRKFHEELDISQNLQLHDRDIIFVPEVSRTDFKKILDLLQESSMVFYDWRKTFD